MCVRVRAHLSLSLDGVHSADELAVGLEQQQQLEVQLVQPATQLQLLHTHRGELHTHTYTVHTQMIHTHICTHTHPERKVTHIHTEESHTHTQEGYTPCLHTHTHTHAVCIRSGAVM